MSNRLRDIKVDRVSFVDKAATRDPRDPTQPRRFLLFKSESGAPSDDGAVPWTRETPVIRKSEGNPIMATATDTQTQTADDREKELAEMLIGLEAGRAQLLKQPAHEREPGLLDRLEVAHKKIALAHSDLMHPGSASRVEAAVSKAAQPDDGLASAQRMAEQIRKSDSSLSASEAFVEAMRDPEIAKSYIEENGGRVGGRVGIAKARQPGSHADIELKAEAIAKSEGLSGSAAYAKALRDLTPDQYAAGLAA
jgi:hypothetical protein